MSALVLSFAGVTGQQPDPVQIMEKGRDLTMIQALKSTMTLTIIEKNGATRVRTVSMISKIYGGTEKRMIRFLEPADVRGTSMLIVDNEDVQDEMWIYLPALKRTRRIVSTEKGKSFMSSEFSNADMTSATLSDFNISHMPQSGTGDDWIIESKPINEDKAEEYGYGRKVTYLRKKDLEVRKIEYYNYDNTLFRYIDILASQPVEGRDGYIMTEMVAKNLLNGRSSTIVYNEINTSADIPENTFAVENLAR
ncbi:MAG TPA: outer membrane lipoprotein-sorting protein [Bacteroidales bacterium]|nr:outer membrane lipoprotein-sorting protein [Bacteroidales bacterium]